MKILTLSFVFLFIFSCAKTQKVVSKNVAKDVKKVFDYQPMKIEIFNGFAKKIIVELPKELIPLDLICNGKKVGFDKTDTGIRTFLSISYKFKKPTLICNLLTKDFEPLKVIEAVVKKYPYKEEFLKVPKKHVDLDPKSVKRWQREVAELNKVYKASILDRALFNVSFDRPLSSVITSSYGKRRVFNNKKDAWHSGVDFRARTPTKIPSANRGKVVFIGHLFFNGKTVIIDHGLGILTMYCHLSKITSELGEIVPKGAIVGISGNTGRSNAPHLHWGVKVSGNWINGLSLIEQGI